MTGPTSAMLSAAPIPNRRPNAEPAFSPIFPKAARPPSAERNQAPRARRPQESALINPLARALAIFGACSPAASAIFGRTSTNASNALLDHRERTRPMRSNFSAWFSLSSPMICERRWNFLLASSSAGVSTFAKDTWRPSIATFDSRCALTSRICALSVFPLSVAPYLSAHPSCSFKPFEPSAKSGRSVW
jgi:hypothetical protein